MSKSQTMTLELYTQPAPGQKEVGAILTAAAAKIILCSQYADLRDEQDKLIATVTWTTPVLARRIGT